MPRFDGTGPWWGSGPMSGWSRGWCACPWPARPRRFQSPQEELSELEQEEEVLKQELEAIRQRKESLGDQK